ncbi:MULTISPECIES: hypothetical protein [unclassified Rathayibacter]|jgi:hypothetical protein|uniref:hypothetical protein n=1 Tax=unclassified Rathayibacter TaxID=2609250 RepID=UPI000CE8DB7D|nr:MULTISPECIES: hypothetical protein [unclassified Rathayibacter]PPF26308.1 hypothetical protein C5C54_13770 [Rathayibacter sp. AY1F2]PPH42448.1 hypothetical protein C5C42_15325 [Rathayibacter sp. AY1F7]
MSEIQPFNPLAGSQLGLGDRFRLRKEVSKSESRILGAALQAQEADVQKELAHKAALREQGRVFERSANGIDLGSMIYDRLVAASGADEAKAAFLASKAIAGRDAIARLI